MGFLTSKTKEKEDGEINIGNIPPGEINIVKMLPMVSPKMADTLLLKVLKDNKFISISVGLNGKPKIEGYQVNPISKLSAENKILSDENENLKKQIEVLKKIKNQNNGK